MVCVRPLPFRHSHQPTPPSPPPPSILTTLSLAPRLPLPRSSPPPPTIRTTLSLNPRCHGPTTHSLRFVRRRRRRRTGRWTQLRPAFMEMGLVSGAEPRHVSAFGTQCSSSATCPALEEAKATNGGGDIGRPRGGIGGGGRGGRPLPSERRSAGNVCARGGKSKVSRVLSATMLWRVFTCVRTSPCSTPDPCATLTCRVEQPRLVQSPLPLRFGRGLFNQQCMM